MAFEPKILRFVAVLVAFFAKSFAFSPLARMERLHCRRFFLRATA